MEQSDALGEAIEAAVKAHINRGNIFQRTIRRTLFRFGFVKAPKFTVSAVVHRANGDTEDLGEIGHGTVGFRPEA